MSQIRITITDNDEGGIEFESDPAQIILSEKVASDSGATNADGVAMNVNRLLYIASKLKGPKSLMLFNKSKVVFTIKDELSGQVNFSSQPTHKFLLQKELSGNKLTNAESAAVRIMRMLAIEKKVDKSKESILLHGGH